METRTPTTLIDAVRYFADPDVCLQTMIKVRWPDGVKCPTCGSEKVSFLANQRRWQCSTKHSLRQFSAKVGTIFEDSPIGLDKWLPVVWLLTNCKNGISELRSRPRFGRHSKDRMVHASARPACDAGRFLLEKLEGEVEADETFIGGLARNMHKNKKGEDYRHWWRGQRIGDGVAGPRDRQGTCKARRQPQAPHAARRSARER